MAGSFDIGHSFIANIAAGIEASTPEAIAAAQVAAGAMTEAMAEQFLEDARAAEESQRLIERVGETMQRALEAEVEKVVKAAEDLVKAAQERLAAVFDGITSQFGLADLEERLDDAERVVRERQEELDEARRTVESGPAALQRADSRVRAAEERASAAARQLAAAERAQETQSSDVTALQRQLDEAKAKLANAAVGGVSDLGWFQDQVSAAEAALAEGQRREQEREAAATKAAQERSRDADRALADAKKARDELLRGIEQAQADLPALTEGLTDAQRAAQRAALALFEDMVRQGIRGAGVEALGAQAGLKPEKVIEIIAKADTIVRAQANAATVAAGGFTREQMVEFANTVAQAIADLGPSVAVIDPNQILGLISTYLAGGLAP